MGVWCPDARNDEVCPPLQLGGRVGRNSPALALSHIKAFKEGRHDAPAPRSERAANAMRAPNTAGQRKDRRRQRHAIADTLFRHVTPQSQRACTATASAYYMTPKLTPQSC